MFSNLKINFLASAKRISLREEKDRDCASISSHEAAIIYGLKIVDEGIADEKNNVTRFIVLSRTATVPQTKGPQLFPKEKF